MEFVKPFDMASEYIIKTWRQSSILRKERGYNSQEEQPMQEKFGLEHVEAKALIRLNLKLKSAWLYT